MLSKCGKYAKFNGVWYHVHWTDITRIHATNLYLAGKITDT